MSRLPEQRLWDRMRNNLTSYGNLRLQRIEDVLGAGLPDVLCLYERPPYSLRGSGVGEVLWVELKVAPRIPARATTPVLGENNHYSLSVDQRNWHVDWRRHGGKSLIIVSADDETIAPHWAFLGKDVDAINKMTVSDMSRCAALSMRGHHFWHELYTQVIM